MMTKTKEEKMKTIAVNSVKGGTGKTTFALMFINALVTAGYKCLAIDADASNNSLSYYLNNNEQFGNEQGKTVFHLFMGEKVQDCVLKINDRLDLICGDVRLNEFRSTDSMKRLKRALQELEYDYCIIDTSPTYDNIIGNVLTASDVLLIPVQQDIFSYQALKYQFEKLADLEVSNLDTHVIFNQFEKPLSDKPDTYRNQITNLFLDDEMFKSFINPNRLLRSSVYRKYINKRKYQIAIKTETQKSHEEIKNLIHSVLGITVKEAF
jgi:chromosome partitioning protein